MSPEAQARKLADIARLTGPELLGWRIGVEVTRAYFPGEAAALVARERELDQSAKARPAARRRVG